MIVIDNNRLVIATDNGPREEYDIGSKEAFHILSRLWLRSGWDAKYVYSFTWLGRPIIQLPEDLMRIQEVIWMVKPDVIIETGIAHGGSLIFYATLCKAMERGRVIGVDIEIRPHNRKAIESHQLFPLITLIEGDSVDPAVVNQVKAQVRPGEIALVLLDSCHEKEHVLAELKAYAPLVTQGSYIVAMDGIKEQLVGAPRSQQDWSWNNPKRAALEFVENNPEFIIEEPLFLFNEGNISERVTYWPSGFIKRVR
jgi:cephalosporin hydroxylase